MKRELKVFIFVHGETFIISYTACPNEEGTESLIHGDIFDPHNVVTQHVPMKRELKEPKR